MQHGVNHAPSGCPMVRTRRTAVLWLLVAAYGLLAASLLLLATVVGSGIITWDVKGFLLTGWHLGLFTAALAALGMLALLCAWGLWGGRRWSRPLALLFWLAGGLLGLVTDRAVPGPGEPLAVYVVNMILIPAAVVSLVLWTVPAIRRFFD
jgi:hypothetical protein